MEIVERCGEPEQRQYSVKRDDAIWRAIEEVWPQVPAGSTVEIWQYSVEGGSIDFYFIDGSDIFDGTGFSPEEAVS